MTRKPLATATLAAALAFTGVAATNYATADAEPATTAPETLTVQAFADRYRCEPVIPHNWSQATPLLTEPKAVKTSVYALPSDATGLVRRGTNKATASALASYGSIRLVCRDRVPFSTRVAWS